ncbi:MAG: endoglucanase-related protein glucosyl hydrolase family 9 protein, partial [Actinomycetota bacterium]
GVTNIAKSWISTPGRVTKWTQNLTFGALADKTYGDLPFTLNGISDQGQPVSYASSNTSVCTVSGSVVSIVAAGSCDITASQAGNTTIAAATPITQTLTVNKASQTITFAALSNVTYSSATISIAPTAASQLAVTSVSDDTSVCTLTNNVISVLKAGTCSITASQAGNTNYNAANSVTRTFQIAKASQTVEFTPPQFLGLQQHEGVDLVATSTSGLSVTFSVSNTAICDIQSGKLIPVSTGACVITVAQAGDDRYEASSDIHTVTVADYPVVDAFAPSGDLYTNTSATSFTITFASAVTGFAAEDLVTIPAGACTIAEPQLIPASSASYTVELTGCAEGPVSLKLLENTVSNGIPGPAEFSVSTASVGIDFAFANGVTITPGFTSPTNDTALVYTVTFAEAVTGFDASDLEITGTGSADCVATVTGSGASYTVSLADCTDGTVVLKTKAQSVADLAANVGPSTTATAAAVTVDRVAPEGPTVTGMPTQYSRSTDLNANFTVDNQLTYRCQLNGVDLPGCDGSLVIPAGSLSSGDYTLEIWAVDAAGNESTRYSHSFSIGSYARPSAPVIGLLDRTSYNHLVVNWAAVTAQSTELPVTALRFEYSVNGGGTWTAADDLAADATSYDLTVQSGQTYSIRLKALSGEYAANASDFSATASYVAVYKPTITGASTSAALLKPATGTVITLTGNDLRDFSVINPALNTGTVVTIIDSANKTYTAELVSVTATSIRFKVPAVSKVGVATYKVTVGSASYQRTSANRNLNIVAKKVNQVITFTAPASTKVGNADTQLGATLDSLAAPVYNLAASSTGICTLTSTGVLHPIKGGVCSYTITSPASDAFNAFTSSTYNTTINRMDVAVAFELPADLLAGLDSNNSMPIKPITYSLTAIPSDQVQGVSATIWATPETVCFVDADKVLRIIAVGTCTVSAVAENDYYRTTTPVTRSFTIVKNDQNLTYVAPGTTFGMITAPEATDATSGFQLTAFLDSGLTPDFASLTTQVCTVDPSGFVAWVGDLVKNPAQVCDVTIGQAGDSNFNAIPTQTIHLTARHVPPQPPVGGYIVEPDGSLAVSRTGGLAAAGSDGVAVVVVTGSKITITPFSKGMYIGPITATVTIPYYVRIKNVATLKTQVCTIKWGILKKMKATDPTAFKVKQFKNTKSCAANKDVISYFKEGNRLMPTIVVKRDRKWPTTYLGKEGSNGKGPKIWPRVKTWHLTIG